MEREIKLGINHVCDFKFFERDETVIPESAALSIYDDGNTALVSDAACTIESDGNITYTIASTLFTEVSFNNRIDLTYYVGSIEHCKSYMFDVVNVTLESVISDNDLYAMLPELKKNASQYVGKTTATGTTTTLIDSVLTQENDYWTGGYIEIYIDDESIFTAHIDDYVKQTKTITFSPAASAAIASGTDYKMRSSYQDVINRAFEIMRADIRAQYQIAGRFINSDNFKNAHIYKTLEIICRQKRNAQGDRWDLWLSDYVKLYANEMSSFNEIYDEDDDNEITEGEERNGNEILR